MTEKNRKLYHCDRCGELFRALVVPAERVICNLCGNPPIKAIHSKLDHSEMIIKNDTLIAKKKQDQADFIGAKRVKRKKQARIAVVGWILLLMVGGGSAVYYKTKQEDLASKRAKEKKVKDYKLLLYKKREGEARFAAGKTINQFMSSTDLNTRSLVVFDGVNLLLQMNDYYDTSPALVVSGSLSVDRVRLMEDGPLPVLETVLKDDAGKEVEVVFVKQDNRWKIDWSHFVRYNPKSWNRFVLLKEEGSFGEFRLYVRQREGDDDDVMDLIFYEPKIFDGGRGLESPEVELNKHTEAGKLIAEALDSASDDKKDDKKDEKQVLASFDDVGLARVNVDLGWVKEGGSMKLVIRKVLATHWMTNEK